MDNLITLYKTKWNYNSNPQPYFKTENSRDEYLSACPQLIVNKEGVNINQSTNLDFIFKISIDITQMVDYNFVGFIYNGVQYYADILDYSHISVNRTRILCRLNPLFNVVNFLSFYSEIILNKATFDILDFTRNRRISVSEFKMSRSSVLPVFKYKTRNCDFIPAVVLFLTREVLRNNAEQYLCTYSGIPHNVICAIYPLDRSKAYKALDGTNIPSFYEKDLNGLSPYIISYQVCYLPYYINDNIFPFVDGIIPASETNYNGLVYIANCNPYFLKSNGITTSQGINFIYSRGYNKNGISYDSNHKINGSIFDKLRIYIIGDYYIDIDLKNYSWIAENEFLPIQVSIEVDILPIIEINRISYKVLIKSNGTADEYFSILNSDFPLEINGIFPKTNETFSVSSEESFVASNRFYDFITGEINSYSEGRRNMDAAGNIGAGLTQFIESSVSGSPAGMNQGLANTIRGVSGYVVDGIEIEKYKTVRNLEAANEKNKPGNAVFSNESSIYALTQVSSFTCILYTPIASEINAILLYRSKIGFDVNYSTNLDEILSINVVNGFMYLSGFGFLNKSYPVLYYDVFRDILKGCLLEVI